MPIKSETATQGCQTLQNINGKLKLSQPVANVEAEYFTASQDCARHWSGDKWNQIWREVTESDTGLYSAAQNLVFSVMYPKKRGRQAKTPEQLAPGYTQREKGSNWQTMPGKSPELEAQLRPGNLTYHTRNNGDVIWGRNNGDLLPCRHLRLF